MPSGALSKAIPELKQAEIIEEFGGTILRVVRGDNDRFWPKAGQQSSVAIGGAACHVCAPFSGLCFSGLPVHRVLFKVSIDGGTEGGMERAEAIQHLEALQLVLDRVLHLRETQLDA